MIDFRKTMTEREEGLAPVGNVPNLPVERSE